MQVPIFPLPNVVFFPRTILPLHVFEPRYRRLVNDVLGGDRRFAVFLLKPATEAEPFDSPALFDVGCLGEIIRAEALEDGRFNLLLLGLVRIRIQEFVTEVPYRVIGARVDPDRDEAEPEPAARDAFRELVRRYARDVLERDPGPALDDEPLETLVNSAAANLEVGACERQALLQLRSLSKRMSRVSELMGERIRMRRLIRDAGVARPADPRLN